YGDAAENHTVVAAIEVLFRDPIANLLPGAIVQHQPAKHGLLRLERMRRNLKSICFQLSRSRLGHTRIPPTQNNTQSASSTARFPPKHRSQPLRARVFAKAASGRPTMLARIRLAAAATTAAARNQGTRTAEPPV